jgi:Arc/MetJ-type ribon-helix-helix transcriptional regulator
MKRMTITLPGELATAVNQERRRRDTSASEVVRAALETLLVEP